MSKQKRNLINKAIDIECQICNQMISSYNLTNHIRFKHYQDWSIDKYVETFGEFRKNQIPRKGNRNITKVICEIPNCGKSCSIVGMHNHLRDSHDGLTPDQYVLNGFTEYRPDKIRINNLLHIAGEDYKCLICQEICTCEQHLSTHLKNKHNLSKNQYVLDNILFGKIPKCGCGCGEDTSLINSKPYFRKFLSGHNGKGEANGMFGRVHSEDTRYKMKEKAALRDRTEQKIQDTDIEIIFKNFLQSQNIQFQQQFPTKFGIVDFYLPEHELFVEIDGSYWHPTSSEKIPLKNVTNVLSDINKLNIQNLIRIRDSDVSKITKLSDLQLLNFKYDYSLNDSTVLFDENDIKYQTKSLPRKQLLEKISNIARLIQELIKLNHLTSFEFCSDYKNLKSNILELFNQINDDENKIFTLTTLKVVNLNQF